MRNIDCDSSRTHLADFCHDIFSFIFFFYLPDTVQERVRFSHQAQLNATIEIIHSRSSTGSGLQSHSVNSHIARFVALHPTAAWFGEWRCRSLRTASRAANRSTEQPMPVACGYKQTCKRNGVGKAIPCGGDGTDAARDCPTMSGAPLDIALGTNPSCANALA